MFTVVPDPSSEDNDRPTPPSSLIDQIVRDGARRMLAEALQAEVDAYIAAFIGERQRFASAILPAWARKTPKITEVLPLLYLHGLSTGDFVPALGQFLGSTKGLSAPVITKLTEQWQAEQRMFAERDLSEVDYVYLWSDGIHVNIRLEEHKLCLLVLIGVRVDGRKELVALADGYRESTESWSDLLRDCKRRGMRAPVLAAGDGALGSGARYARCSRRPGSSGAGFIEFRMCLPRCQNQRIRRRRRRWPRFGTPRIAGTPWMPSAGSKPCTRPSFQGSREDH